MMRRFWARLAVELGRRAGLVAVLGLLLTIGLGLGATQLKFATGTDSYLNKTDPTYKDSVAFQERFGGEAGLTVITMKRGHKVTELLTDPASRKIIEDVSAKLRRVPGVRGVIDPVVAMELSHNLITRSPDNPTVETEPTVVNLLGSIGSTALNEAQSAATGQDKALREADTAKTTSRVLAVPDADRVIGNPAWTDFLLFDNAGEVRMAQRPVFPDSRHALILTRFRGNMKVDAATEATNRSYDLVKDLKIPNTEIRTTGAPELLVEINDYLRGGMVFLGGIALVIMVLIISVLFNVRWRLLPLAVIVVGVIWAFGLAGWIGIPLTLVTVAGLPVMLGIGIDYAIQMHARVEEEAVAGTSQHPIQETARNLCPALLVVTFDALFAFLALRWAKVPMLREFALLLMIGVAVICLASIVVPLATLGIREYRRPTQKTEFKEGWLGRLVVRLGGLPAAAAVPLAVLSIAVFLGGISVEKKLHIQTDPVKWVNPNSQLIKNTRYAEREVHASSELAVFIKTDKPFSDEVVAHVDQFTNRFRDKYGLDSKTRLLPIASSIVEVVSDLTEVPGAKHVSPSGRLVEAAYRAAPADVRSTVFSEPESTKDTLEGVRTRHYPTSAYNVVFLSGPGTLEARKVVVEDMVRDQSRVNPPPAGTSITPSGLVVVGVGLLENLEKNRILLTYLSIAFVAAFLAVRMRSVVRSLLSLVPVLIAVGVSSLVAFAFDLELSPMTAVGGPLVVAACTEFTSLILLRFVEERARGHEPQEAVDITAARTGRAFIVSALTAISGVAVISLSSMPLLRDFGRVVGMNVAVALLSALVILPPMLVWADKRGWVSKGMMHDPNEPYIEVHRKGDAADAAF
ncbi:MAG: MMPL family transporter [Microthrixaceae bacterium]